QWLSVRAQRRRHMGGGRVRSCHRRVAILGYLRDSTRFLHWHRTRGANRRERAQVSGDLGAHAIPQHHIYSASASALRSARWPERTCRAKQGSSAPRSPWCRCSRPTPERSRGCRRCCVVELVVPRIGSGSLLSRRPAARRQPPCPAETNRGLFWTKRRIATVTSKSRRRLQRCGLADI